jgi:hypothetical protein
LGIGGRADSPALKRFVDRYGLSHFTQLDDDGAVLWDQFGADGRSTFLFMNDDGTFWRTGYGQVDLGSLTRGVEDLIGM